MLAEDWNIILAVFFLPILLVFLVVGGGLLAVFAWWSQRTTDKHLAEPKEVVERRKRCECVSCAYNLTANTSGRCPECGSRTW
jgi:hypothetical protein